MKEAKILVDTLNQAARISHRKQLTGLNKMTTINQVCKAVVNSAIDHDYLLECKATLKEVYLEEYGYYKTTPTQCRNYLQGLPTVCTVPFYNGEILELLAKHGITRKSEDAQAKLIDDYWKACGNAFYNLVKQSKALEL